MVVASPNRRKAWDGGNQLFDLTAAGGTDVWAVGTSGDTLVEHLGHSGWKIVRTPVLPTTGVHTLYAASGTGAGDVWAVGDGGGGTEELPLVEHWDGAVWRVVASFGWGAHPRQGVLTDVAAIAPDDAWVVGYLTPSGRTLLERWDGSRWHRLDAGIRSGWLRAVSASDASNVWALGSRRLGASFVERWNGSTWKVVSFGPKLPAGAAFYDVLALGPKDVWLAGDVRATAAQAGGALTAHWDGSAWSYPVMPDVAGADLLVALTSNGTDVWAVGSTLTDPSGASATLIERWNGSAWHVESSQNPGPDINALRGVASTGGSVWAAGTFEPANDAPRTLIERLCLLCAR